MIGAARKIFTHGLTISDCQNNFLRMRWEIDGYGFFHEMPLFRADAASDDAAFGMIITSDNLYLSEVKVK